MDKQTILIHERIAIDLQSPLKGWDWKRRLLAI